MKKQRESWERKVPEEEPVCAKTLKKEQGGHRRGGAGGAFRGGRELGGGAGPGHQQPRWPQRGTPCRNHGRLWCTGGPGPIHSLTDPWAAVGGWGTVGWSSERKGGWGDGLGAGERAWPGQAAERGWTETRSCEGSGAWVQKGHLTAPKLCTRGPSCGGSGCLCLRRVPPAFVSPAAPDMGTAGRTAATWGSPWAVLGPPPVGVWAPAPCHSLICNHGPQFPVHQKS